MKYERLSDGDYADDDVDDDDDDDDEEDEDDDPNNINFRSIMAIKTKKKVNGILIVDRLS